MGVPRKHRLNLDSENGFSKRSAGFDGLGTSVMGKTRRIEELPQTVNQAVVNPGKAASLFSMTRLWAVFWVQLVLMLPALGLFLATPASLGTLYLLVLLAPVGLASSAYAAWQAWRYPPRRGLALATVATPAFVLGTPFLFSALGLEPVSGPVLALAALAAASGIVLSLLFARRHWQAGALFQRRGFNGVLLAVMFVALLMLWLPPAGWLATDGFGQGASDGTNVRIAALTYYPMTGALALPIAFFGLLYAPAGLLRNPSARLAHAGQLICALALLGSLGLVLFGLLLAVANPG